MKELYREYYSKLILLILWFFATGSVVQNLFIFMEIIEIKWINYLTCLLLIIFITYVSFVIEDMVDWVIILDKNIKKIREFKN